MYNKNRFMMLGLVVAMAVLAAACGGGDAASEAAAEAPEAPGDTVATTTAGSDTSEPPVDDTVAPPVDSGTSTAGNGVILADLCAGNQPLNGAISVEDLVGFGLFTSPNVTIESNATYDTAGYELFGFICNISEDTGNGENFLTIGLNSGSDIWDLAVEQGGPPVETMGEWEVLVGTNWLSPLTMRTTDAAGNQDSLYATWTPADGSIPDAETLERVMRPLAEAIATRSTVDIPRG